jgi:hypothetical protein
MKSMKKNIYIVTFLIISLSVKAQYIKLSYENSFNKKYENVRKISSSSLFVGVDFHERKYFYFSTYLGINQKSVIDNVIIVTESSIYEELKNKLIYLDLESSVRIKYPINQFNLFIGLRPSIGYHMNTKSNINGQIEIEKYNYSKREINDFLFTIKPEFGLYFDLDKFRIESTMGIPLHINSIKSETTIRESFYISISLGIRI